MPYLSLSIQPFDKPRNCDKSITAHYVAMPLLAQGKARAHSQAKPQGLDQ